MIRSAYLRVYQPLASFPEDERNRWVVADEASPDSRGSRWLVAGGTGAAGSIIQTTEGAFVKRCGEGIYVCPWTTRLRVLSGLLAFRDSVPEEVAEAFVPLDQARRAAQELAEIERDQPDIRAHILHANWHVPLSWFAAFVASERILMEDKDGLRIRYETSLEKAPERLDVALSVLAEARIDDAAAGPVEEVSEWLRGFSPEGILELDYASVAGMFPEDELLEDHSAEQVQECLQRLRADDLSGAGRIFAELSDRWAVARASEVMN